MDNYQLNAPKDLDNRTGRFTVATGGWRPYNDLAEFLSVQVAGARYENMMFWVRSITDANRSDLYALDKNKNPIRVVSDVDLSNYYTKGQIDTTVNNLQDQIDAAIIEINGKVNKTGDVITGTTTFSAGQTRFTNVAGRQLLLLGNQDSLGVNKPTIIEGHDGGLGIGYGDSWTDERGGNYTPLLEVTDDELTYKGQDISSLSPVQSVNGRTGVVTGLAEQSSLDATNTAVGTKANQTALQAEIDRATAAENLLQPKNDDALNTTSKVVVGGINEVKSKSDSADAKADVAQEDIDVLEIIVASKANINSPVFTGNPTSPTPPNGDNSQSVATTAFVINAAAGITVPDATNTVKGKVKLAGDLGGTADSPTVPGLSTKANATDLVTETTRAMSAESTLQNNINASVSLFKRLVPVDGSAVITDTLSIGQFPKFVSLGGQDYPVSTSAPSEDPQNIQFNIATGVYTFPRVLFGNEAVAVLYSQSGNPAIVPITVLKSTDLVDGFNSQDPLKAGSAKNDYLLNQQIEGGWASEVDYPAFVQGRLTTTAGDVGASIQKNVVSNANFGTMEIAVTPGEYFRISSVVQSASGSNPVLYLMENGSGTNAVNVVAKKNISTIASPEIILIPTGVVKLYVNVYMTAGWSSPTAGVFVKKLIGLFKGTKERITILETTSAATVLDVTALKGNLPQQEGDILNGNFNLTDGRINTTTGIPDGDAAYKTTDPLPVIPGNSYRYAFFNNALGGNTGFDTIGYYDKNNVLISRLLNNSIAPAGSAFARFTFVVASTNRFSAIYYGMVINSVNNAVFLTFGEKFFVGLRNVLSSNTFLNLSNFIPEINAKSWVGKTLAWVGDSWTEQYSAIDGGNFVRVMQRRFGFANAYRICYGGQSFCQLPAIIAHAQGLKYLPLPSEAAIANVDCLVLFLGQNSRVANVAVPGSGNPIGTISDTPSIDPNTSTIYGQVKYHVEYFLTANNKMRLYLSSPGFSFESNGLYLPRLKQIAEAIKNVAAYYSLVYIPMFEEAWGIYNYQSYLRVKASPEVSDFLHPSYMGTEINKTNGSDRIFEIAANKMIL